MEGSDCDVNLMPNDGISNVNDKPSTNLINDELPPNPSKRKRSVVWKHFTMIKQQPGCTDSRRAACNHCGETYFCDSKKHGTSTMLTHANIQCKKNNERELPKGQTTLSFKPKAGSDEGVNQLVPWSFSVDNCRKALAKMIIVDELPFKFVENEGFRELMEVAQPKWVRMPCRTTVARDCVDLYGNEKKKLKKLLKGQRICLTTDTWTYLQNLNYMCLTAHYIDSDWKLNKKILNFCLVSSHKGETIGKEVESCLFEWGIDKFLTLTVDNASSNNGVIHFLKKNTKYRRGIVLEHEFLHMRCCAHILNLIVCEGLKEMDDSIIRIRGAVRYVRGSPSRMAKFKMCADKEGIDCKSQVCLDVSTRWNSTYFMLERAIKFEKAFDRLEDEDEMYKFLYRDIDGVGEEGDVNNRGKQMKTALGLPNSVDWQKARSFVKFLKLFYNATLKFSGSLFVTSNSFFIELMVIKGAIMNLSKNSDLFLSLMAKGMQSKFDKYWGKLDKMNSLLLVAVVLDPRYKSKYIDWCLRINYDAIIADEVMKKVADHLSRLYDWYACNGFINVVVTQNVSDSLPESGLDEEEEDARAMFSSQFRKHVVEECNMTSKSELDKYLTSPVEIESDDFEILGWWGNNSTKYPILSQVARDVLAIPVSTVASESAFSTGGRILDPFRSSLSAKMVEALICTQNWLRSSKRINLREAMDDVEHIENIEEGLVGSSSETTLIDD